MSETKRYQQLLRDLRSEYRPQRQWIEHRGVFLVIGHFLVGGAAGTWLLGRYYGVNEALIFALVLAAAGGLAHLLNLGRPMRAVMMMKMVRTSWVARGFWGLFLFFIGAVLYLTPRVTEISPWSGHSVIAAAGDVLAGVGAIILVGYMGFAYMASRGIAFWNSKLHPLLYVAYSARSGVAGIILVWALLGRQPGAHLLEFWMAVTVLVIILWIIDLRLAYAEGTAARQSAHALLVGHLALYVYGGVLVLGIILPAIFIAGLMGTDTTSRGFIAAMGLASAVGRLLHQVFDRQGRSP